MTKKSDTPTLEDLVAQRSELERQIASVQQQPLAAAAALFEGNEIDAFIVQAKRIQGMLPPESSTFVNGIGSFLEIIPAIRSIIANDRARIENILNPVVIPDVPAV